VRREGKRQSSLREWQDKVEGYEADAKKLEKEAEGLQHEGRIAHSSSNFFDLGELESNWRLSLCSWLCWPNAIPSGLSAFWSAPSASSWRWAAFS